MFRFTIRDVLWLTVMVALGIGWWLDRRAVAAKVDRLAGDRANLSIELEKERDRAEQATRILTHTIDTLNNPYQPSP